MLDCSKCIASLLDGAGGYLSHLLVPKEVNNEMKPSKSTMHPADEQQREAHGEPQRAIKIASHRTEM